VGVRSKPQAAAGAKPSARKALFVSLAVHALFWVLGSRVQLPAPPARDDVTIEIVEVPAAAPAAPIAEVSPQSPAAPARRPERTRPPEQPRAAAPPAGPSAGSTAPKSDEISLGMRFPDATPQLSGEGVPLPSAAQLGRAGIDLAPAGAALPVKPPKGESAWTRSMNRRAREEVAQANVAAGKAPPEAFDLLREIERRYQPSHKLVADLTRAEAGRSRSAGRWLGRYLGGFLDHDPTAQGQPFEADAAFRRAIGNARLDYAARVCVSYGADGKPVVEIDGGSKIDSLDRLASDLVLQAADRRGPGLGGAVRACYRFTARLERVPPLPVFFCGLNGDLRPECIYPLKEIASTSVKLDGVELAAQAAPVPSGQ
jgi:hypothetical protein